MNIIQINKLAVGPLDPFVRLYCGDGCYFSTASFLLGAAQYPSDKRNEGALRVEMNKDSGEDSKVVSAAAIVLDRKESKVTPVVIYPNADLDKERILAENLRVICVYR